MPIITVITAALAVAISAWARWLHRKGRGAQSLTRALACAPVPLWLLFTLAAGYGMWRAFDTIGTANAAVKASQLAASIAWSMYVAAAGLLVQLVLGVVLAVLTWRHRRSRSEP